MKKIILFCLVTLGLTTNSWSGALYSPDTQAAIIYYSTDADTVHLKHCHGVSEENVRKIMEEFNVNPYTFIEPKCKTINGAEVLERSAIDRNLSEMKKELARAFALSNKGEDLPDEERKIDESSDYSLFLTAAQNSEVEKLDTDKLLKAVVDQASTPTVVLVSASKLQEEIKGLLRLAK